MFILQRILKIPGRYWLAERSNSFPIFFLIKSDMDALELSIVELRDAVAQDLNNDVHDIVLEDSCRYEGMN